MNYIGRKDGGKYIASTGETVEFDASLLVEIVYVPEIAQFARENSMKYRDAFIMVSKEQQKEE